MSTNTQPDKPTLFFRGNYVTFDNLKWILDRTALSPLSLFLIPALAYFLDQRASGNVSTDISSYPVPSLESLKTLVKDTYPWLGKVWLFILLRGFNKLATRYVRNHGEWKPDRPNWKKEVVVITGGAAGIGKATVELLSHNKRAKVAVLDMAPPSYAKAPPGAPEILYFKTDVSDPAQVKSAADQIRAKFGEPTILMNCAGVANGSLILEAEIGSISRLWRINTLANWITAQEFLPAMVKANHGHIMTVASSASYMSLPQMAEYATSKSAALSFHEVLSGEINARYGSRKIRTSICCPTKVRTALGDGMEDHADPFITPNLMPVQVGQAIVDAFDSGLSQYVIMPEFMRILPWMRAVPDWMRRIVNVVGNTDNQVSDKSVKRALNNGYGADWDGDAKEARQRVLDRVNKK
ncbi:NAD(P)-binding protein [Ceraceosorus guamensis]|uniref:Short-chain dehydrogenase/reductase 3 n=1 Tax=Ceraceosorus guamensis TaxID=1522189 RepID=A0A316VQ25_9BASI|nr:NAD(P)-binding protein [Ceraceosorus guamensis]PWN39687.1 NAD(P)-binding protein [Ceraceosorus guamensis]